jgi:AraC-like DNA-binding protein
MNIRAWCSELTETSEFASRAKRLSSVHIDSIIKRAARVTTDQGHSRLGETIGYNLEVSTSSDSMEQTKQNVLRTRCLRSDAETVPAERPRIGAWRRSFAGSQPMPVSSGRIDPRMPGNESSTAQLLSSAHEDLARLADVLRHQQCTAALRGIDGVVLPIDTSAHYKGEDRHVSLEGSLASPANTCKLRAASRALSTPIYDAEGRTLASLELTPRDPDRSDSSDQLLRALLESTARSITERWFRLAHRKYWIVAALRRNASRTCVILALDRDQRIVAADRNARQLLEHKGRHFEKNLPLSAFFHSVPAALRQRGYGDAATTLHGAGDAEPWMAIVTAPDIVAGMPSHDARAMLHVRPRWDCLTRLLSVASDGDEQRGLSRGSLKRLEEYVEANIDSALDIDELAAVVRMSPSHFARSFSRSAGLTPHRYVIQCRVAKARELLAATDLALTDIALNVGFSDQSHFSRRFQELVGVPPGAYRRGGDGGRRQ